MDNFDKITIGNTITERYLEDNRTVLFDSIGKEYDLKYRIDLISSQADFKLDNDNSKVYEVVEIYNQNIYENTTSILANQTNGSQETKLVDEYGNDIEGTMLNQLKVAQNYRLSGGVYNSDNLDTNFYTPITSNGGTVTVANSEATLSVTTTANSSAGFYSNSIARYMGGNMNYYRAVSRVNDLGAVNNTRRCGVCDIIPINNGAFFQISNTTFSCVIRKTGVDTVVSSGSFNGVSPTFALDINYHTFEIYYTNKRIQFVVDGKIIHTFTATTSSLLGTLHLRAFLLNTNTGVGSAVSCSSISASVARYGTPISQAKTSFQQGTTAGIILKLGVGSIHRLVVSGVVNNSVVSLYDGTSTAGVLLWSSGAMTNQTVPFNIDFDGSGGTAFNTGLFLTITGFNSNCFIKYE